MYLLLQPFTDPSGRDLLCIPNRKRPTLLPQQEEKGFSPYQAIAQPMRDRHISAIEKPLHLDLPVCSNGLSFITTPSNCPLSFIKISLLFVLWTRLCFAIACLTQIVITLLFPNKPNMLVE